MKKIDLYPLLACAAIVAAFILLPNVYSAYNRLNDTHGMLMAFMKFAVLATFGESLGLRIQKGVYNERGFGILPRAIVWGFLGMGIKMAMVIFASGTPRFLAYMGMSNAVEAIAGQLSMAKVAVAFGISVAMNCIFAPVFMTLHKITDTHILQNGGTIQGFLKPIRMAEILQKLNWNVQWNFVFKKTIPFFWIPAHTITFILPEQYQVLFAAMLGVALGLILATASYRKK